MQGKLIVFDWNGTLLSDTTQSWRAGNACLEVYDAPPMSLPQYRSLFTFPILEFYKRYGVNEKRVLAHKEEANAVYQKAYETSVQNARTRRGARTMLEWVRTSGARAMILSNYIEDKIEAHLNRLNLAHYFEAISAHRCNGTSILEKTSKEGRLAAYMKTENIAPEHTIIVGDSTEEPEIARALGLTSIGITDGSISRARLKAARPDHIIHRLDDIPSILQRSLSPL